MIMIDKLKLKLFPELNEFFINNFFYFVNFNGVEWVRSIDNSVFQVVNFSFTRDKKRLRIHIFVITSSDKHSILGGRFNGASLHNSFGGDQSWLIETNEQVSAFIKDFKLFFNQVMKPWFNIVINQNELYNAINKVEHIMNFANFYTDYQKIKIPNIKAEQITNNFNLLNKTKFNDNIANTLNDIMNKYNFIISDSLEITYIRKRGKIYDVILIEYLNYGLHFGVYVFNWLKELSLDGSDSFNRDLAFMGNGGAISTPKKFKTINAEAFMIGNKTSLKESCVSFDKLLKNNIIPKLESIENKNDYISSVLPKYKNMLKFYPKLMG